MTMKTLSAALLATLSLTAPAWAADNSQTTPQGHWEWQPSIWPAGHRPCAEARVGARSGADSELRVRHDEDACR